MRSHLNFYPCGILGATADFFNSEVHWDSVKKRFSSEYAAWKSGAKIVVFALTSPAAVTGRGPSVRAHQIVLMHVSENWIPLDSSYEAVVAEKLDAEHRQYVKPMRYDASISEVFPDFYLLDTKSDKPFPMEVFGMATPAYLARKQLKKIITTVNMGLMDGGTGMRPQHLKLWCCLIFQNHANLFQLTHLLKMEKKCPTCFR